MIENKAFPPYGRLRPGGALWRHAAPAPTSAPSDHKPLQTSTVPVDNFVGNSLATRAEADRQTGRIGLLKKQAGKSF
ncbi:hypothetical protein [Roseateles sp. MS654]|uniref:hypothetical protein n=1 Tax=Roseateles sp. MS654 TaxID=3412685 RepID=UPI003C2B934A